MSPKQKKVNKHRSQNSTFKCHSPEDIKDGGDFSVARGRQRKKRNQYNMGITVI